MDVRWTSSGCVIEGSLSNTHFVHPQVRHRVNFTTSWPIRLWRRVVMVVVDLGGCRRLRVVMAADRGF